MAGQGADEDNFAEFRRLDADAAETDPAAVAGVTGGTQHKEGQLEENVEDKEELPEPGDVLQINEGGRHKTKDPQHQSGALHNDIFIGVIAEGGAVYGHQSQQGRNNRQIQKQQIGVAQIAFDGFEYFDHGTQPFLCSYYFIIWRRIIQFFPEKKRHLVRQIYKKFTPWAGEG